MMSGSFPIFRPPLNLQPHEPQPPKPTAGEMIESEKSCHKNINKGVLYQCELKVLKTGSCVSAIGQGFTMHEANQDATKNLINKLKFEDNLASQAQQLHQNNMYQQPNKLYEILNRFVEPVSKLQLISVILQKTGPVYVETGCDGPSHLRKFTTKVSFDGMVEHGIGNSKKVSKANAASKILGRISQKLQAEKEMLNKGSGEVGNPVIKSMINDIEIQVKGNRSEIQTQTDPQSSTKESCDIQTQTKSKGIDQIGPIYDSDSDSDCDNSNLNRNNSSSMINEESIKNETESGELIESEEEEEEEKELKGFDFESLFNDEPSTSSFSEMPKYSRTGVIHEEKSQIFQDMLTKMSEGDRVVQENENYIKRHRPVDKNDYDANLAKKPKMVNFVSGNVSHDIKPEMNTPRPRTRNNEVEEDDDVDQMVNMDKIGYGVGSQLMLKMGFTPGQGLGKNQQGIKVPIKPQNKFTNYKNKSGKGQRGWIP